MTANRKVAEESQPVLDAVLGLLDGVKLRSHSTLMGGAVVPLSRFNRSVLMSSQLGEMQTGDQVYVGPDVFSLGPIHSRVIGDLGHAGDSYALALHSFDSVTAQQTKGRVCRPMSNMLRIATAFVDFNGTGKTVEGWYGVDKDGVLVDITNNGLRKDESHRTEITSLARMTAGLELYLRYSWTVEIGSVGSNFKIRIPTSPSGARDLLALRDVEPGMKRRRALRHWVAAHSRRQSKDEADKEVSVRSHLRGVAPFRWEDLEGVVRPSAYDLESNPVGAR